MSILNMVHEMCVLSMLRTLLSEHPNVLKETCVFLNTFKMVLADISDKDEKSHVLAIAIIARVRKTLPAITL